MSNGRAFGSEGRWSIGSMANLEEGRMYPDVDSAGVRIEGRPFLMLLCAPILHIRLHWRTCDLRICRDVRRMCNTLV